MTKRPPTERTGTTAAFDFDAPPKVSESAPSSPASPARYREAGDDASEASRGAIPTAERDIYTVSRLNREARFILERGLPMLWLEGEMSNLTKASSGHWYFSLKDSVAQIRACMFRTRNLLSRCQPRDGLHVLVRARVSLYEARGEYQLVIDHMEDAGEGELRRRFEALKAKLQAEGLFEPARKRALPSLPRRIGVLTSRTGAAIRDILNILRRRFPAIPVLIYPVPVQGFEAPMEIAQMLRIVSARAECDVLIVARGGGSLEDLWAFNTEMVARAMANCRVPTVTGIGHEVDFTIADFIADVRAPTPSGAAELVVPDAREWLMRLEGTLRRIVSYTKRHLHERGARHSWLNRRLAQCHPGIRLAQQAQRLDELEQRVGRALSRKLETSAGRLRSLEYLLARVSPIARLRDLAARRQQADLKMRNAMRHVITASQRRVDVTVRALHAFSPLATLDRGYAIVTKHPGGELVRSSDQVKPGEKIEARLNQGRIRAIVEDKGE